MSPLLLWSLLGLTVGLAAALAWRAWRKRAARPALQTRLSADALQTTAPRLATAPAQVAAPATEPLPAELAALNLRRAADLTPPEREALATALAGVTRPPGALLQLLSVDFMARASTSELSDLVMAEPLMAARLLGQVNAPLYGLRRPVTDMAQAVALLGLTTVRSICVQYLLTQSFQPSSPSRQRVLDRLWRSSAIASELSVRLGKALNLPDQGTLPTRAVLGFVGPVATASLLPPASLDTWLSLPRAHRAVHEQGLLGLCSGEIGGLLMASWQLPQPLIDEVWGASRLLDRPADDADPAAAPRHALSYLCAHLAERLSAGQLPSLTGHDFMQEQIADTHHLRHYLNQSSLHLRSYLGHPPAARLQAALQAPELLAAVQRMNEPHPA